MMPFINIGN